MNLNIEHSTLKVSETGFTLVEVLVALVLLTVGLIPAFIQASAALTLAASSKNVIVATYLAQEGIEVVHAMRDDNWFHRDASGKPDRTFDAGFGACATGCQVQWDSAAPQVYTGDPALKQDATTGMYQYATGTGTPFHRTIVMTKEQDWRYHVVATVTWEERTVPKSFVLDYYLYNWLQE